MKLFKLALALPVLIAFSLHADDKCGCNKPKATRPTPQQMPRPASRPAAQAPAPEAKVEAPEVRA